MLTCDSHKAFIYDRGGLRQIGALDSLGSVKWARERDDISAAEIKLTLRSQVCENSLQMMGTGRSELVLFRGTNRVWEGPITRSAWSGNDVTISAKDVMHYAYRTAMHAEYDDRYPNNGPILDRVERIMQAELARKEALNPAINVLPHMQIIRSADDPGTAAHTLPMQYTVFEHIDAMAARSGIDYTVVGRSIIVFDTHNKIGQTPPLTDADFIGNTIVTEYGMELATHGIVTDGKGNYGMVGEIDPYYGEWEMLDTAFDESDEDREEQEATGESQEVSIAELQSQAERNIAGRNPVPTTIRIPSGSSLNPVGAMDLKYLVPGTWVPLTGRMGSHTFTQMQKLDQVTVEQVAGSPERIGISLSPAPQTSVTPIE